MRYLIVSHSSTDKAPTTIYERVDSLTKAKELCEKLAAEHANSSFSYYEWTGGYSSTLRIETDRLWNNPWIPPVEQGAPE